MVVSTGNRIDCGGFAGSTGSTVESCYSHCTVMGINGVGGFVVYNGGEIINSYSYGAVRGELEVAGFVVNNRGALVNCYSSGVVSGKKQVGGFVFNNKWYTDDLVISSCIWDKTSSGVTVSNGGTGLVTEQMQNIQTFLDAGWDFAGEAINGTDDIWTLSTGGYPRLSWE